MFLEFKKQVTSILRDAIASLGLQTDDLGLEASQHADIASKAAFRLASQARQNPKELAERISEAIILPEDSLIGKITTVGPYINIDANRKYIDETVFRIRQEEAGFGGGFCQGRILLEHTSANPNGPLHVGHIRNSIIGDTLMRVLRRAGYDVETQYYVNDMGRQIAIVSWALSLFGFDSSRKPDHAIADVYIKANAELIANPEKVSEIDSRMQLVEKGDEATIKSFDDAVAFAIKGIRETLQRMNVTHDSFPHESGFIRSGAVSRIVGEIKAIGRTEIDNGALVVDLSDYGFEKTLVIQRSDGTSLYTTRDLAYHEWKGERADRMIDVLGADHKLISGQLKATLNAIGKREPEIVIFEFVSLPEGSMSTRRGKFIPADELLDQIEKQAYAEVDKRRPEMPDEFKKEVARNVGIGAVRYDIVKVSPEKSTVFNWKEALDFEKQGGPFIQYSHARACNILKKAEEEGLWDPSRPIDPSLLVEDTEVDLVKKMASFDSVIDTSARELKPNAIAIYARELAESFNQFYRFVPVINAEDEELRAIRLALVDCARIVLASALDTLGIAAPESM
ncbi:arginine--tRNA ligase [Methanolobus halotolerans]|uniref:Arginine--tRNA ligase n=1 Tax=Methanolobus halotolerans TaxID=2052935 RepID=A0A4E0PV70_9EURY|nr:arginine--tRNA ligase [Methanolobus halotolerans]TGC08989.1 arginine--tRNA ligase [Methanolobus halotolerans]